MQQDTPFSSATSVDDLITLVLSANPTQTDTGRASHVVTTKGGKVKTAFKVVDASTLIISNNQDGTINPNFPKELQPRDRTRLTSKLQVQKIAAGLRPEQLGDSGLSSQGAPIIGPDNVVESGNGRSMGIYRAYQQGQADDYRQYLIEHAADYGFSPDEISQFKQPVLVRERQTEVDRAQFAKDSNLSDLQEMSASEKAFSDAQFLSDNTMKLFAPSDDGSLLAKSNMPFVQAFLKEIGDTASAGLLTSDGRPTKQLIDRLQNAIFAKAYKDDRLVKLVSEEPDPDMRNILTALNVAAPDFAQMSMLSADNHKQTVGGLVDGVEGVDNLDKQAIAALQEAINMVRDAKDNGQAIEEVIAQQSLFGEASKEAEALALFIVSNNRSAKRMGTAFKLLASKINDEITHQQQAIGDMFGDVPVDLKGLLTAVSAEIEQEYGEGKGINFAMFEAAGSVKKTSPFFGCKDMEDLIAVISAMDPDKQFYDKILDALNRLASSGVDNTGARAAYQTIMKAMLPKSYDNLPYWQQSAFKMLKFTSQTKPTAWGKVFFDGAIVQAVGECKAMNITGLQPTKENIVKAREVNAVLESVIGKSRYVPDAISIPCSILGIGWKECSAVRELAYKMAESTLLTPEQALAKKSELEAVGKSIIDSIGDLHKTVPEKKSDIAGENREYLRSAVDQSGGKDAVNAALAGIEDFAGIANLFFGEDDEMNNRRTFMVISRLRKSQAEALKQKTPALYEAMKAVENKINRVGTQRFRSPDANAAQGTMAHAVGQLIENSRITKEEGDQFAASITLSKLDQTKADKAFGEGEIQRQLSMIYRLAGGRITTLKSIKISDAANTRAHANISTGGILLSTNRALDVLWHEMGHHLEFSSPDLLAVAKALIRSKRKDDSLVHLSGSGRSAEYGFNCGFSQSYIGRSYNEENRKDLDGVDITEIVSMALQSLVNNDYAVKSIMAEDTIVDTLLGHLKEVTK